MIVIVIFIVAFDFLGEFERCSFMNEKEVSEILIVAQIWQWL